MVVAGGAPHALHALHALAQGGAAQAPLLGVAAIEGDEVQIPPLEVQAQGGAPAQLDGLPPLVDHLHRPGDEVAALQYAVVQLYRHFAGGVGEVDHQGLPFVPAEKGGQAGQGVFPLFQLKAGVAQVGQPAAVRRLELDGGQAEIAHAAGGVLLGQGVQGVVPAVARLVGVGGGPPVRELDEPGQVAAADSGAVVGVEQHPVLVRLHLVGGVLGVQGKDSVFLIEYDHRDTPW